MPLLIENDEFVSVIPSRYQQSIGFPNCLFRNVKNKKKKKKDFTTKFNVAVILGKRLGLLARDWMRPCRLDLDAWLGDLFYFLDFMDCVSLNHLVLDLMREN